MAIMEVLDPNCPLTAMGDLVNGEVLVSFASQYLMTMEGKLSPTIVLAGVVNWLLQRCKRFLHFATHIEVIVPTVEYVTVLRTGMEHLGL